MTVFVGMYGRGGRAGISKDRSRSLRDDKQKNRQPQSRQQQKDAGFFRVRGEEGDVRTGVLNKKPRGYGFCDDGQSLAS